MNFRSTKIARTQRSVQNSDCESRGKLRELTFMDKEARIYFPRSSYARHTYMCVACHVYTHTDVQHAYLPIYREGNLEIHGRLSTCRFLPVSQCVCVRCDLLSPSQIPQSPSYLFLFRHRFSSYCALWVRAKKAALVPRGHWPGLEEARTAIGLSTFRTGEAETSRAEAI